MMYYNDIVTPETYTLSYTTLFRSLRGRSPVGPRSRALGHRAREWRSNGTFAAAASGPASSTFPSPDSRALDRKSTRLNSSHQIISYAVFCLKRKKLTTLWT